MRLVGIGHGDDQVHGAADFLSLHRQDMKLTGFVDRDIGQNIFGDFATEQLHLGEVKLPGEKILQLVFRDVAKLDQGFAKTAAPVPLV